MNLFGSILALIQSYSAKTWIASGMLLFFSAGVSTLPPESLSAFVQGGLAIAAALLSGFFTFQMVEELHPDLKPAQFRFLAIDSRTLAGAAAFIAVLLWWLSSLSSTPNRNGVTTQKGPSVAALDSKATIASLRAELPIKNDQIKLMQHWLEQSFATEPSARARELAAKIPDNADPYALGLKAIAQQRFAAARRFLAEAQGKASESLAAIYEARGQAEQYDGRYAEAVQWFAKISANKPDDPKLLSDMALAFQLAGDYEAAETLYRQAMAIRARTLGPHHPDLAISLNNLAVLSLAKGDHNGAEGFAKRALAIREKALGPNHPEVAASLSNLAGLYYSQGRYSKTEPLLQRALAIQKENLGLDHLTLIPYLNSLAGLYDTQGRYTAAEPLLQRALAIREKALGPQHPEVATSLNNLAELYYTLGKYAAAELLLQRALAIRQSTLGPDHPELFIILEHYAALLRKTNRPSEAVALETRAKAILDKQAKGTLK